MNYILLVIGFILLVKGADYFVDGSSSIAKKLRIPSLIIGLTIVAIGTALPEMVTSVIATIKDEGGLAVGNLVGSCILNSFLILGTGAIITPLEFTREFLSNLWLLAATIGYIWVCCFIGKKDTLTRYKASILVITFAIYMWRLFV